MARILSEIGRKLSRIFLGRIVVRALDDLHRSAPARIMTHFHSVSVQRMRVEPRVGAAMFVKWSSVRIVGAGDLLGGQLQKNVKVHSARFSFVTKKKKVSRYKLNISARAGAKSAMMRIQRTPITRRNRINFLKSPPKFERSTLLALYSPIFQEKVAKSALDKASGNLLFWYDNERVKAGEKYHLLLLRVFEGEEPLKWLWLPAAKRLS